MKLGDLVMIRTVDDELRTLYNTGRRSPKIGVVVALRQTESFVVFADVLVNGIIDAGIPESHLTVIDETG